MKIFVINLARRKDRLAAMSAQLGSFGLRFETVPAIDAAGVRESWLQQHFTTRGPLGLLPKGDLCCSLSHRKAWSAFLASGVPFATILEDDVALDSAAAAMLQRSDWLPPNIDLLKLEHFGPQHQRVLVGPRQEIAAGRTIAPILSRHTGAAAYIISRAAAEQLTATEKWSVPVDHLLFNPNVSEWAVRLKPYQLLPAIARQIATARSDIRAFRVADRKLSLALARREIVRAYYELRLVPRQVAQVLAGRAWLMKVANEELGVAPVIARSPAPATSPFYRQGTA